nr:acyl-CoA dehydrogenase C-terminal domain-containing protein [uncultured Rhodoferax sp.]
MVYFWAVQSSKAAGQLASGKGKESIDFYTDKIQTAEFCFARPLPRVDSHFSAALAPTSAVMQMPKELFQME